MGHVAGPKAPKRSRGGRAEDVSDGAAGQPGRLVAQGLAVAIRVRHAIPPAGTVAGKGHQHAGRLGPVPQVQGRTDDPQAVAVERRGGFVRWLRRGMADTEGLEDAFRLVHVFAGVHGRLLQDVRQLVQHNAQQVALGVRDVQEGEISVAYSIAPNVVSVFYYLFLSPTRSGWLARRRHVTRVGGCFPS